MDIGRKFVKGAAWSVIGNGANNIISFVIFAIITRVVEPEVLGVVAFAMVFIDFGRIFVSAGIPDLIVRQKVWDDTYAATCFWVNLVAGALAAVVAAFVLAPLVDRYFVAGSGIIVAILGGCFVIDASRVVHESILRRNFDYKRLAARGVSATLISGVIGVVMALTGWGIWALVAQRVGVSVLTTLFTFVASSWVPKFTWNRAETPGILAHGIGLVGASTLRFLNDRLSDLMLGLVSGPVAVAQYRVGARGFDALSQLVLIPLAATSFSGFSRIHEKDRLAAFFLQTAGVFAFIAYPLFFGSAIIANEFVELVFGPRWQEAAGVMFILSLSGGAALISVLLHPVLSSVGRTGTIVAINAVGTVATLVLLFFAVPYGPFATAVALTIRSYIGFGFNIVLISRVIEAPARKIVAELAPPLIACLCMLAVAMQLKASLLASSGLGIRMGVLIPVSGLVYAGVLLLTQQRYVGRILRQAAETVPALGKFVNILLRIPGLSRASG